MPISGTKYELHDQFFVAYRHKVHCVEIERIYPWPSKDREFYKVNIELLLC